MWWRAGRWWRSRSWVCNKSSHWSLHCEFNKTSHWLRPNLADVLGHRAHFEGAGAGVRQMAGEIGVVLAGGLPTPNWDSVSCESHRPDIHESPGLWLLVSPHLWMSSRLRTQRRMSPPPSRPGWCTRCWCSTRRTRLGRAGKCYS